MKKITCLIMLMFFTLVSYGQIIGSGFENGMPQGWLIEHQGPGSDRWAILSAPGVPYSGTSCISVTPNTGSVAVPVKDWLITSQVDLTGIINPKVSFYGKNIGGINQNSKLEVRLSTTNTDFDSFNITLATYQDYTTNAPNPISPVAGDYARKELNLLPYVGQQVYIAFVVVNEGAGKTWFLDDISVYQDCPQATNLGVNNVTATSATATWSNPLNVPGFEIDVMLSSENPTSFSADYYPTGTTQVLSNLSANTEYKYYIRSICGANSTSEWAGPFVFGTTPLPAELPYNENFEAYHGWEFINGTQVNKWFVGTATHNGGLKSLYISNDQGVSNTYTTSGAGSTTFAYRLIQMPATASQIELSFDWKADGESTFDYLRVWLVPSNFTPTAGTQITELAGERIRISPQYLNRQATWLRANYIVNVTAAMAGTNRKLVFEWRNDGSGGAQPPAAVDNISIKQITCSVPTNLVLGAVTQSSAVVSWTAPTVSVPNAYDYFVSQSPTPPADNAIPTGTVQGTTVTLSNLQAGQIYYVWVRGNCGDVNGNSSLLGPLSFNTTQTPAQLPYSENFDATGVVFGLINGNQVNKWMVGSDVFSSPTQSLYVTNNNINNTYTVSGAASTTFAYRDINFDNGVTQIQVAFDWRGAGEGTSDRMRVWLVPSNTTLTVGTAIPTGGQRIQIGGNFSGNSQWTNYSNVINVPAALAGTTVKLVFEWRNDASSGTQPPAAVDNILVRAITCAAPTNLVLNSVTTDTAVVSWTAPTTMVPTSYDYFVSQSAIQPADNATPTGTVTVPTATLTGLLPGQTYFVWVRGNCGTSNSLFLGPLTVSTNQIPAQLPYTENFDTPGFVFGFNNGNQVNKWIVGTDTFLSPGNSLYISNNNLNNTYTTGTSSVTQAYRDIEIPVGTGEMEISFDWKAQAESCCDYLRVWLVPVSFVPTAGTQITALANQRIRISPDRLNSQGNWINYLATIDASVFAGTNMRLVFEWRNDSSGGTQPPAAVDNINVRALTCSSPNTLTLISVTDTSATLTWNEPVNNAPVSYDYFYSLTNTPPTATTAPSGSTLAGNNTVTITGLQSNTTYYFWVRGNCGLVNGNSNLLGPVSLTTTQVPAQLPYSENFDTPGFVFGFNNGTQVNKWMVGNDTFLSPDKSLYISNNDLNNTYTTNTASVTQAYRDVFIPANTFQVQLGFSWKAQAESCCDYLRVWLVPSTFTPTPGTLITAQNSGGIQIGGNYNARNTWQSVSVPVDVSNFQNTTLRLVFEWRNDSSGGTQPPAAVDDISISIITCPAPTNLQAELSCADSTVVDVSWTPGGTETSWEYAVLPATSPQPTSGTVVTQPEATKDELDPDSEYSVWVRALCGGDAGNSVWIRYNFVSSASPVASANPFCAGPEGIVFPNVHRDMNVPNLTTGSFHCLGTTPNPVWYYLKVDDGGQLNFQIVQNTEFNQQGQPIGRTLDVDFIAFGPFDDLADACSSVIIDTGSPNPSSSVVGCSYSAAAIENFSISNAQPGQVYAVLITNFNGSPGFIKLVQTNAGQPGAGSTDCDFLCEVELGPDRNFCDRDNYLLKATVYSLGAGAVTSIQWFFNGVLMDPTVYNTLEINVNQTGEYSIIIERENCDSDEIITDSVNLVFATTYDGEIPEKLTVCDLDNDGVALFDLDALSQVLLANYPDFSLEFYANLNDANLNENPLNSPYESGSGSIFVKIVDSHNLSTCVRIEEIELEVLVALDPVVEFSYSDPICVNNVSSILPILVDDFTLGGVFTSTEGLVIDRNTGEIDLDNSISGEYIVNYKFDIPVGMCGNSDEYSQKIKVLDRIGFMIDGRCKEGYYTITAIDVLGTLDFNNVNLEWSENVMSSEGAVAKVDKPGIYDLTITTIEGCQETVSVNVIDTYCQIQKGISPNGDGLNDRLVLYNFVVQKVEIFNRYGKEVYSHGVGYTDQWYGQSNSGSDLPSGTYFYNIVTSDETFTGWIQLVREEK